MADEKKAAFVAIVGRPSAGKSTLLNAICGWKVSIVSPAPQTTRNRIRGIANGDRGQLVFVDTPGYHESDKKMNILLRRQTEGALSEADILLYVLDATRGLGPEEELVASLVAPHEGKTVVVINKTDDKKAKPEPLALFIQERLKPAGVFFISALKDEGLGPVIDKLFELAPVGPAYYPEEFGTDQEPEFRITEIVREKAFLHTRDELPHAIYAELDKHTWNPDKTSLFAMVSLYVERESQKGILVGKDASVIKKIRQEAEKDLNEIFPYAVKLRLDVKVDKNWRQNAETLKRLGLGDN
jgi:GTP-binding protein Era